jgi:glycosyltransferase involved in cell wall biosynthesis
MTTKLPATTIGDRILSFFGKKRAVFLPTNKKNSVKKVSIITRAYNRLEYTIRCINSVRDNTVYPNYEHIIVNNNSSDGTEQWLHWIKGMENRWFDKVIPIHSDTNRHDFGGLVFGMNYISPDSVYVVQLDNDIKVPKGWLQAMMTVIEKVDSKVVMLKRTGVQTILTPNTVKNIDGITGGEINTCVACFMLRVDDFRSIMNNTSAAGYIVGSLKTTCFKITSMTCHQIEGWNGRTYIQHDKYQPSSKRIYQR